MKQLTLQSEAYRYIIASFKEWLQTIGYNEQTTNQLPNHIQEFLYYAESKGFAGLFQITNDLMKEHYYKLKDRTNKRKEGGLSAAYLNKHLQALHKFSDYLRQNGRLLLPRPDIQTEEDHSEVTDILTQPEIKQLFEITYLPYEQRKNDKGIVYYEAMQYRDRAMVSIFYGCGLRRNEAVHLDINDIILQQQYNYSKFKEWLLLKKYSPATTETTARIVEYFRAWAESESITELEEISYPDAMMFMQ